jgi:phosphate/sulfate permease
MSQFIRIWIPLILLAVIVSVLVASLLGVPLSKSLTVAGLTIGLVLSGFFFRSYGRGKWEGRDQQSRAKFDG